MVFASFPEILGSRAEMRREEGDLNSSCGC